MCPKTANTVINISNSKPTVRSYTFVLILLQPHSHNSKHITPQILYEELFHHLGGLQSQYCLILIYGLRRAGLSQYFLEGLPSPPCPVPGQGRHTLRSVEANCFLRVDWVALAIARSWMTSWMGSRSCSRQEGTFWDYTQWDAVCLSLCSFLTSYCFHVKDVSIASEGVIEDLKLCF